MPAMTTDRPPRHRWTLGWLMFLIVLIALALTPLAILVHERRVTQERLLVALMAEQAARARAEQVALATREALTAGMMTESGPPTGPDPQAVRDEMIRRHDEIQRLRRRIAELEARVAAFPNPKPAADVRAEGGLTLPANHD